MKKDKMAATKKFVVPKNSKKKAKKKGC